MTRLAMLVLFVVLVSSSSANAQGTYSGTVTGTASRYYSFTPSTSGQFTATLSWDNQAATLFVLLVCGNSNPQAFGVGAGGLDRVARLESGLIGLQQCLLGVSGTSTSPSTGYRITLQSSTAQLATPQTATLSGLTPASTGLIDARLIEHAERIVDVLDAETRR